MTIIFLLGMTQHLENLIHRIDTSNPGHLRMAFWSTWVFQVRNWTIAIGALASMRHCWGRSILVSHQPVGLGRYVSNVFSTAFNATCHAQLVSNVGNQPWQDSDFDLRMNQQVGIPAWQWLQECTKEDGRMDLCFMTC